MMFKSKGASDWSECFSAPILKPDYYGVTFTALPCHSRFVSPYSNATAVTNYNKLLKHGRLFFGTVYTYFLFTGTQYRLMSLSTQNVSPYCQFRQLLASIQSYRLFKKKRFFKIIYTYILLLQI